MKTNLSMSMKVLQTMPHEVELLLFHFTCLLPTLFQTINNNLTAFKNVLTCYRFSFKYLWIIFYS